jgi:hypothetical protein
MRNANEYLHMDYELKICNDCEIITLNLPRSYGITEKIKIEQKCYACRTNLTTEKIPGRRPE